MRSVGDSLAARAWASFELALGQEPPFASHSTEPGTPPL
jgi:hypothetical protein